MDQTTSGWSGREVAPAACRTMPELRAQIDRLDRVLVRLIAERQRYIERAAEIKETRDTVRDEARVEDVIAKVLDEAGRAGLSPAIAEPVWRLLVECSIAHEFAAFDARPKAQRSR
ncbi:MAG: chorismate mutase [Alphaproteobacteria bacterium]|nr:chorismate mutase [Alphaproteobacteria bacterium]MDE2011923.1 chorismate mutase [Alphaproteobacteria bacterium]MDE2072490.1 chorismate mutase [Alphaproteobacteria bacterium]MDE2351109.1 chorismate mutase [Alphaproteobacteria bacterium]